MSDNVIKFGPKTDAFLKAPTETAGGAAPPTEKQASDYLAISAAVDTLVNGRDKLVGFLMVAGFDADDGTSYEVVTANMDMREVVFQLEHLRRLCYSQIFHDDY